jgi:hypothetical protein
VSAGAYLNLPNRYIARFYSHAIAQARTVPFPFFNLGNLLGPVLIPRLSGGEDGVSRGGWVAAGVLMVLATLLILDVASRLNTATTLAQAEDEAEERRRQATAKAKDDHDHDTAGSFTRSFKRMANTSLHKKDLLAV